jgi:hypothetical protein
MLRQMITAMSQPLASTDGGETAAPSELYSTTISATDGYRTRCFSHSTKVGGGGAGAGAGAIQRSPPTAVGLWGAVVALGLNGSASRGAGPLCFPVLSAALPDLHPRS